MAGYGCMKTNRLRSILEMFKRGESLDGVLALEAYVKEVEARSRKGGAKVSEKKAMAAKANGRLGGRGKRRLDRLAALDALAEEAQERGEYDARKWSEASDAFREEARSRGVDLDVERVVPEFLGTAKDFVGFRNLVSLPPGVKKGSELEARQ